MTKHSKLVAFLLPAVAAAIVICGAGQASAAAANAWTGNLNATLGWRFLDSDWDPIDTQGQFGLEVDFRQQAWPVSAVFGFSASGAEDDDAGVDFTGGIFELDFGVKKVYDTERWPVTPFAGVGLTWMRARVEADNVPLIGSLDDDDSAWGLWLSGGAYWTLVRHLNLGVQAKWVPIAQKFDLLDGKVKSTNFQLGFLVGYHW